MPKKIKLLVALCIVFNLLLVVGIVNFLKIPEVIECEILTAKYGQIFEDPKVYKTCSWVGDNFELKVLEYSSQEAIVYYINTYISETGNEINDGTVVRYRTNYSGTWVCMHENTVWSESGSAEGTVMPYWWH